MKKAKKKQSRWSSFFYLLLLVFILYKFLFPVIGNYCLDKYGEETIGYITNEEFYIANNNVARAFTNGYKFSMNDNIYTGNSHLQNMRIGESLYIEYFSFFPYFNRVSKKSH